MRRMLRRLGYFWRKRQLEAELAEEMAAHRAMSGDAKAFGSAALAANQARDVWIWPWLQDLAHDLRFACRLLARDRRFALAAIVALAFGMAATSTVFSFVDAALFKDLPFDQPRQLLAAGTRDRGGHESGVSYQDFRDWQAATRTFAALAASTQVAAVVSDPERAPDRVRGAYVSANTFDLLRARPLVGRTLRPSDDAPGAPAVVVIGEGLWRAQFNGDPEILNRTIRVNESDAVVVGVMPERFGYPGTAELWMPLATLPGLTTGRRDLRNLGVIGRLADGVTPAQAQSEMAGIAERLAREYPNTNRDVSVTLAPPFAGLRQSTAPTLWILMAAVLFVLLIACANVATLLLARAADRAREIAIRISLGATRWRIVRQLLLESSLLAGVAGAVGLALSIYAVRYFGVAFDARETAAPDRLATPYWVDLSLDVRILGFVAAVCLGSTVLFGLVPALHVSKTDTNDALKDGSRGATGSARVGRWTGALMVVELSLTMMLLAGAGLLAREVVSSYRTNLIIAADRLTTARLALPPTTYPTPAVRRAFFERLERELQPTADLTAATVASDVPLASLGGGSIRQISIDGRAAAPGDVLPNVSYVYVGRDYLQTIGLPLHEGRGFVDSDGASAQPGAIVNRAAADRFFPGRSALGRRIRVAPAAAGPQAGASAAPWLTIVGIVPTLPQFGPRQFIVEPTVYVPIGADPAPGRFVSIIARGSDPRAVTAVMRARVRALDADLPLYSVQTMSAALAATRFGGRLILSFFGSLAVIALTLSTVGLFALTTHSVTQRTAEIGVRMALGAPIGQVVWLFLRRTAMQLAIGVTVGLFGALGVGAVLRSILDRTAPRDPLTLTLVTLLVIGVAALASILPARRVARVDPAITLRCE